MLKLTTRGRYGTWALLELALRWGEGPVLLKDIARRQQIPLSYLERLITPLIVAGLVRSARGVHGGVWLGRSPREINLGEVMRLLEGPAAPTECVTDPQSCPRSNLCIARDVWDELGKAISHLLESITLHDLIERQKSKEQLAGDILHIGLGGGSEGV